MKFKNVVIVVNDMDKAVSFYGELFGLMPLLCQEGNVILSEGLVLQERGIWEECIQKEVHEKHNACELYFEERELDIFIRRVEESQWKVEFLTKEEKLVRLYDLDGNLIEVREC